MTLVPPRDERAPAGGEGAVAVLDPAPQQPAAESGRVDAATGRRIAIKLLWAFVLILVLMLFSADEVDFVYKGF